jgi:Dockerin type I domain/PEP-CTERM motif
MISKLATGFLAVAVVLAAGAPLAAANPLHNPNNPLDVDDNGSIRPRDVLLIINRIQSQKTPSLVGLAEGPTYFWDTTDDNNVTTRDALLVVNHLLLTPEPSTVISAAVGLLALAGVGWRHKRRRGRHNFESSVS